MNATNLNRYNKFFNAAVAALDGGFATAAAKKEANSNVSRAYECVRDSVFSALLDAGKNDNALNLTFELRHVKLAAFLEISRGVGYECGAEMEKLIALRAAIAAEEVVKKVKVVKTVADTSKGERLQYRGNCQACGRNHAIVDGFVAQARCSGPMP